MKRIKRALFALLREEIMEWIGYQQNNVEKQIVINHPDMEMIKLRSHINMFEFRRMDEYRQEQIFNQAIEQAQRKFADEVLKNAKFEVQNLFEKIHLTLIQKSSQYHLT